MGERKSVVARDSILCPYCGNTQEPTTWYGGKRDFTNRECTCKSCERAFRVDRKIESHYKFISHPVVEKRYYVQLAQPFYDNDKSSRVMSLLNASGYFDSVKEYVNTPYYQLTQEQIEQIDKRYLAFAVPVEQVLPIMEYES